MAVVVVPKHVVAAVMLVAGGPATGAVRCHVGFVGVAADCDAIACAITLTSCALQLLSCVFFLLVVSALT